MSSFHKVLENVACNILGIEATKRMNRDVCIAFMHRKSGDFLRFQIKLITVTEVSLDLMELK
jgi:formylmethanofuran dehydrogenase subunit E-like metal-binding protein